MLWEIKRLIHESYRTQYEFAIQVGISESRLSKILRRITTPSKDELVQIAKALGLKTAEMMKLVGSEE